MTKPDAPEPAGGDLPEDRGADPPEAAPAAEADLKATVTLSGEALEALLEEVRKQQTVGRGPAGSGDGKGAAAAQDGASRQDKQDEATAADSVRAAAGKGAKPR
jgi:hypothetical protein